MKIMWKTSVFTPMATAILEVEILEETTQFYTFRIVRHHDGKRDDDFCQPMKRKKQGQFFDTFEAAKAEVIGRVERHIARLEKDVLDAKAELTKVKEMEPTK